MVLLTSMEAGQVPLSNLGASYVPFPSLCPHWPQLLRMTTHVNMKNLKFGFKINSTYLHRDKLLQEVFGFLFILVSFSFCPHFSTFTCAKAAHSCRLIISTTQQHICSILLLISAQVSKESTLIPAVI